MIVLSTDFMGGVAGASRRGIGSAPSITASWMALDCNSRAKSSGVLRKMELRLATNVQLTK